MKARFVVCAIVALCAHDLVQAQTEIRLWPGGARGSEDWSMPESISVSASGDRVITNVSDPTLTVYLPDAGVATGAAAVIAPGGALRVLGFDNEGVKVAEWLNARGIAGFVLKYRTLQQDASAPRSPLPGMPAQSSAPRQELVIVNGNANPAPGDAALHKVLELAVADAQANGASIPSASASSVSRPAAASQSARRSPRNPTRRRIFSSRSTGRRCKTSTGRCTRRHCSSPSAPCTST
jgi:hypothetical protein